MRGRWIVVCSLSAIACLASPPVASAGHPQQRQGFWISLGGGVGSAIVKCDDCEGGREISGVGSLRLGGTLNDRLLLGGEVNLWSKEQSGTTVKLYDMLATLTIYPRPSSGFFFKAGAGVSFLDSEVINFARFFTFDLGTGVGLLAGAGYDLRVRRNVSITPAVSFWYGRRGGGRLGELVGNWSHNVVDFTIGVTFH